MLFTYGSLKKKHIGGDGGGTLGRTRYSTIQKEGNIVVLITKDNIYLISCMPYLACYDWTVGSVVSQGR